MNRTDILKHASECCRSSAYLQRVAAVLESEHRVREAEVDAAAAAPLSSRCKQRVTDCYTVVRMVGRFASKLAPKKNERKKERKKPRRSELVDVAGRKQQTA